MAQIMAGDIRKGVTFEYKSGVYTVTEFQHVKPGKGAAFVRCTLKNVVTGQVLSDETFNPTTKLETAQVETKKMTYSYTDGEFYYFMDDEFNMTPLNFSQVEDALRYIRENGPCTVSQIVEMMGMEPEEVYHSVMFLSGREIRRIGWCRNGSKTKALWVNPIRLFALYAERWQLNS